MTSWDSQHSRQKALHCRWSLLHRKNCFSCLVSPPYCFKFLLALNFFHSASLRWSPTRISYFTVCTAHPLHRLLALTQPSLLWFIALNTESIKLWVSFLISVLIVTDLIFYLLKKSKQISVLYILNSLATVSAVPNQLLQRVKPWPNGPASSRKWTQVELA